jgi:hypothetical protein
MTDSARHAMSDVQHRAGRMVDDVGQSVGQVPQQVEGVARQVGDNAGRMFQDNPLAVGAIAVAVGAAVGMALPVTDVERRTIGRQAGQALSKAETAASEALGQAEDTARDAEREAHDADRQARGRDQESRPH